MKITVPFGDEDGNELDAGEIKSNNLLGPDADPMLQPGGSVALHNGKWCKVQDIMPAPKPGDLVIASWWRSGKRVRGSARYAISTDGKFVVLSDPRNPYRVVVKAKRSVTIHGIIVED